MTVVLSSMAHITANGIFHGILSLAGSFLCTNNVKPKGKSNTLAWPAVLLGQSNLEVSFFQGNRWWHCGIDGCFLMLPAYTASLYVSGKLPTYPSPKLTLTLAAHLGQNVGLGEG